ncbi:peptidoglycan L-alanyl-D-glutamate endopeptidase CwlK [Fontibacillus solani]|uniref:Peptidoglycan L-alanyl-D-glutamate endopeptidase CwlK n=1 Tax=Fontibacillus solani TaxID=1572857 RepID=A0A7W3SZ05_9BACL|nr:M15 family metallopeptidase [Fontibacillus solani]MBA9088827.1 peptidoglycan L-alanyl-D-glutamate endopeptidase CwlK [Fontibacillus solani]
MTLTLGYVKAKSASKLTGLHPVVRQATERLIERSFARGVPILITQGLRTIAEQDALYAQGRTKLGQIVTNARGGYSNHNFGVAIDFALLQSDGKSVSWTVGKEWMVVVEIAKSLGFEWGGDWKSFKDMPHFEMTFGLTTTQYRAGKKPTETAMAKALAIINKEDEEMKEELAKLAKRVADLEAAAECVPAPKWFVAEFGSADLNGLISEPKFTLEGWRTLAVGLRVGKK